jgi:glucose/arabinose dehydrogenase
MRQFLATLVLTSCSYLPRCSTASGQSPACLLESKGDFGPDGAVAVRAETVVSGLEVPWSFAFLAGGDVLVSERPGRVRLLRNGQLVAQPVLTIATGESSEGGLLGIAVHPKDATQLFVYVTVPGPENQLQKWKLSADHQSAILDKVLVKGIAAGTYHDGGRIRFGPDGLLYVATGDAREPDSSQDPSSKNGKLLRVGADGTAQVFLLGIRNLEAFDWLDDGTLILADHGPSGELMRTGHDRVALAHQGDNLGWPTIYGCEAKAGMISPILSWVGAVPPGGAVVYRGDAIPQWKGSFLIAALGATHLHRVVLGSDRRVAAHEVYFRGAYGRLREIAMTPSGELWVSTSNCDGRGTRGAQKDLILRIVPK